MAAPPVEVIHVLERRARFRVPPVRRDPEKAYILEILLRKKPGVDEVRVNSRTASVLVEYAPDRLSLGELASHLEAVAGNLPVGSPAGVARPVIKKNAEAAPASETVFAIEGMTCQSCALLTELVLSRRDDVHKAQVNYASGTASVTGTATRSELFKAVGRLGYEAKPADTVAQRLHLIEREKARLKEARRRLVFSAVLTAPVMVAGMSMSRAFAPRFISLVLTTPLVFGAGRPFFQKAFRLARHGSANMDTLIALGAGAAYFHSAASFAARRKHLFFESAAGIITLILLGRFLEERARGQASEAIRKLVELQPLTAAVIRDGQELQVAIDDVLVGDEVIVRPGERVPIDGEVTEGRTTIDEALVTGESLPVVKEAEAIVIGGTINQGGTIRIRVTATGGDTVLAGIIRMVDQAQMLKVPVQRMADRISAVFVPAVIGISGLTGVGWWLTGHRASTAVMKSVSVLLISCPCSLGLATPTAIMAGTGSAARQGIYIRNAEGLENARGIDVLVLDKTGTITEGKPAVTDLISLNGMKEEQLLGLVAGAEYASEHYAGRAIMAFARDRGIEPPPAADFEYMVGRGIRAEVEGSTVLAGNELLFSEQDISLDGLPEQAERIGSEGKTPVLVAVDGKPAGILAIADRPREGSAAAVRRLRSMGVEVMMVTGDNPRTGRYVADEVGIEKVVAEARPEDKLKIIRRLKAEGRTVGMIGDGVNDAPALAEADVGFAVSSGTDIAMETAHITLVGGDIAKAAEAIALSKKTMAIIRENLFWAFAYNTLAIPLAVFGRLTPTVASGAMTVSSVSVVANSLRLQKGTKNGN